MKLALETISTCNRICPTCIRNSFPEREKVQDWFDFNYMPTETAHKALEEWSTLDLGSVVCLSHFNEPIMDHRIADIAAYAKSFDQFVYFNTNGDLLDETIAKRLDGVLDRIRVALYIENLDKRETRAKWIFSLFNKTEVVFVPSDHIPTHFSSKFDVKSLSFKYRNNICLEPMRRVIINHRGQYNLCCEDINGIFALGAFPETSIKEYWISADHIKLLSNLMLREGRFIHSHCLACPRK